MARITARQALTRARSRRDKRREETSRAMAEAKTNYLRKLSNIGIMVPNQSNQENRANEQSNDNKPKIGRPRKNVENNLKITDFFPVHSRGRENLPKSPQVSKHMTRIGEVDVVTISDSEDDNEISAHCNPQNLQKCDHNKSELSKSTLLKKEPPDVKAEFKQGGSLEISTSLRLDQDVEIVTILPPIPLRDHPLYDLEDD